MLCKYINEHKIVPVLRNGFIEVEGKRVGISNLPKYLEEHKDIAAENGYIELVEDVKPEYNEKTQYIEVKYTLEGDKVYSHYEVSDIVIPEVIFDENTEHTEPLMNT